MEDIQVKEILRSRDEKRILTGTISGIEDEYYKLKNDNISCAIIWRQGVKVLIPVTHLVKNGKSKSLIRGMLGSEVDFIVIEYDEISNIAIASRIDAMKLRAKIELPKLSLNDVIKVRIIAVGVKHVIVDMYGCEVTIKADNLKHTYIVNCKELYKNGDYLRVRIKKLDIKNNNIELSAKDFEPNPFKTIRKYIAIGGEYTGTVIKFPKQNSGILVQLDETDVTCLIRVPARFNSYPHYMDKVIVKITEIKEDKKFVYGFLVRII